jgi:hypothetical protein
MRKHDEPREKRYQLHAILIVLALALVAGRISTVINREGDSAMLSANDRSRWVTVAAMVERGTFAIDELIQIKTKRGHRLWDTIDKVRHVGSDGQLHYYSSKPTLLTTVIAAVHYSVHAVTGLSLIEQPIYMVRLLLLLINIPLLALFLITMALSIEWSSASGWAKQMTVAASCFATMLTPFAISLNNHLFAAAATSLTLYLYLRTSEKIHDSFGGVVFRPSFWLWGLAGASAAFAVACELPSLSMFALWAVMFALLKRNSIPGFLTGAAIVFFGVFATNYWVHQSWKTPYAHRGTGEVVTEFEWSGGGANALESLREQVAALPALAGSSSIEVRELAESPTSESANALSKSQRQYEVVGKFADGVKQWNVQPAKTAGSGRIWQLAVWDDWYDYPNSYWRGDKRRGVDLGETSRLKYAFHASFGYYGLFSLTPIWLLMPLGLIYKITHGPLDRRFLAAAIALATAVCFAFYVARPEIDRNYGGVSVCFRWMLWFVPLWIYAITAELDQLSESKLGRYFAIGLIAASVFSVSTSLDSPWQSPWLYRFASFLGWMG